MKPILLVGEAPNQKGETGLGVALLAKAAGYPAVRTPQALRQFRQSCPHAFAIARQIQHVNLLEKWPGRQGKGSAFPIEEARAAADEVLLGLDVELAAGAKLPRAVLLAGKRVGRAFCEVRGGTYFEAAWHGPELPPFFVVPHPSGCSTWWNSRSNQERCYAWLSELAKEKP